MTHICINSGKIPENVTLGGLHNGPTEEIKFHLMAIKLLGNGAIDKVRSWGCRHGSDKWEADFELRDIKNSAGMFFLTISFLERGSE